MSLMSTWSVERLTYQLSLHSVPQLTLQKKILNITKQNYNQKTQKQACWHTFAIPALEIEDNDFNVGYIVTMPMGITQGKGRVGMRE